MRTERRRQVPVIRLVQAGLAAGVSALALATPAGADVGPAGVEGCIASGNVSTFPILGLAVHYRRCTYTARRRAGYAAVGSDWSVSVTRTEGEGETTTRYSSRAGSPHVCDAVIRPGNVVTVTAGRDSLVAAGNPVPDTGDRLPTDTGKCVA
jgi:hypothetical protein